MPKNLLGESLEQFKQCIGLSMIQGKGFEDTAFVLHSLPYRETSLIVELFCREGGRMPVMAKGAKRPNSALRSVLLAFQPIRVRHLGKGEVRTLADAEWLGGSLPPMGRALFAAYYLNELLLQGLQREDAHPELFDVYRAVVAQMAQGQDLSICTRNFELRFLQALGYGLTWHEDVYGQAIEPQQNYCWKHEAGWLPIDLAVDVTSVELDHSNGGVVGPQAGGNVKPSIDGASVLQVYGGHMTRGLAQVLKPITRAALAAYLVPHGLMSKTWMEFIHKS
jgi:DNA repair protein RecO (recombination protein O)